jgi:hypothetical protein
MKYLSAVFVVLLLVVCSFAQRELGSRPTETGGPLMFEQAVYDVQNYDITLNVDLEDKSITGTTVMTARTVIPTNVIVLDLDTPYTISKLTNGGRDLKYERKEGKIWIWFPFSKQVGEEIKTSITYSGSLSRRSLESPMGWRLHVGKNQAVPTGYQWHCRTMEPILSFPARIIRLTSPRPRQCTSPCTILWSRAARANWRTLRKTATVPRHTTGA